MITACDLADLLTDVAAAVIEAVRLEGRRGVHRCQVTVGAGCVRWDPTTTHRSSTSGNSWRWG